MEPPKPKQVYASAINKRRVNYRPTNRAANAQIPNKLGLQCFSRNYRNFEKMPSPVKSIANEPAQPQSQPPATSRSPSPAPPAPLASAPGPRAAALQKIFHDALQHTLDTCNYTNFSKCFPTTAKYAAASLEALWTDFIERLGSVCRVSEVSILSSVGGWAKRLKVMVVNKERMIFVNEEQEFDAILNHRNVIPSLNELDNLISDARRRKEKAMEASVDGAVQPPIPPHTLPPDTLLQTHLTPFLNDTKQDLETRIAETQSDNANLMQQIEAQRKEIESLMHGIENVVGDLEGSVSALSADNGVGEVIG
ncbi:MAG: hypothetical protein M1821_007396 [Bathelium mastoideum]|nr:MAG: hypothetical protein M1821_007396 [Bathelium mastoideum]